MKGRAQDFSRTRDAAALRAIADELGRGLGSSELEHLTRYVELVVTWNRKLDLTAARDAKAQLEVLLVDALVLASPSYIARGSRVLDIGTGAGAPALALALARPDLQVTLVEPLHKRVAFLRTVIGTLGCAGRVSVLNLKIDPAEPEIAGGPFDVAMSRATFAPETWVPLGVALARRTIALLAAQTPPSAPAGAELVGTYEYELPFSRAPRCLAIYAHRDAG